MAIYNNLLHAEKDPIKIALKEIESILENLQNLDMFEGEYRNRMGYALAKIFASGKYNIEYVEGPTATSGPFHKITKKEDVTPTLAREIVMGKYYLLITEKEKTIQTVIVGATYTHYKGKKFLVLAIARNEHDLDNGITDNLQVVYQGVKMNDTLLGINPVFIRPLDEFIEYVNIDGKKILRFSLTQEK